MAGGQQRVTKAADVRRREILDTAARLFSEQGYAATSVQQVIDAIGIAKGTFYHHFSSKDEVLAALVDDLVGRAVARATAAAAAPGLDVPTRILAVVMGMHLAGDEAEVLRYLDEHAEIHQRSTSRLIRGIVPVLTALVEEGVAAGVLDVPHPAEVTEFLLTGLVLAFDDAADAAAAEAPTAEPDPALAAARQAAAVQTVERALGAAPGTFSSLTAAFDRAGAGDPRNPAPHRADPATAEPPTEPEAPR